MSWTQDQSFESSWWGNCINTFGEETKQITYAHRMGLTVVPDNGHWPVYDMQGKSVVDLGGGPVSMLLKCKNVSGIVVDPCNYPDWIKERYKIAGIDYIVKPAEEFYTDMFDECWIYNVLQHVMDPKKIIENARSFSKVIRIFEWIDLPAHIGHPHELKEEKLNDWLGAKGTTEQMNENGCYGKAYYNKITNK